MNVAFLPVYPNPYQRLLRDALRPQGVSVELLEGLPSTGWLRARRGEIDILHYHWLYGLYMARLRTPLQVAGFVSRFRLAQRLGYRVVWTAHNVMPHRAALWPLHVVIRRLMMREADAVIVHCEAGRRELLDRFSRRGPIHVVPHGHYKDVYPLTRTREDARAALGIDPSRFVYLALGNIAPYKGLERFVEAFRRVAGDGDVALIAGRNRDAALVRRLERAAAADPRVRLRASFVPDDKMQLYLLSADVLVAPFERILTSGSVIAGLSCGLPVIATNLGCLPELVNRGAGLIYEAGKPDAFDQALIDIKQRDWAAMSAAAQAIADGLGWDEISLLTASIYEACLTS
jgi:glycosyltransferase involved in cell wall biosynthesis